MNKRALRPLMAVALWMTVTVWGCGEEKTQKKMVEQDDISKLAALPTEVPFPADNAPSDEKVALGRLLFFDPILSGHRDVACATCHHPEFGFAESLELSIGANGRGMGSKRTFNVPNDIPFVKRNSQTILNAAFNGVMLATATTPSNAPMFWDVRAKSLENQALEPIKALEEMRGHQYASEAALDSVVNR